MPEYAGVYQLTSWDTTTGTSLSGSDLEAAMEIQGGIENQYVEVKDGKTIVVSVGGTNMEIEYAATGNVLTFQDMSGPSSFVFDGDTLAWEVLGSFRRAGRRLSPGGNKRLHHGVYQEGATR